MDKVDVVYVYIYDEDVCIYIYTIEYYSAIKKNEILQQHGGTFKN